MAASGARKCGFVRMSRVVPAREPHGPPCATLEIAPRVSPFLQPTFHHLQAVLGANRPPGRPGHHPHGLAQTALSTAPSAEPAAASPGCAWPPPWPPSQPCTCGRGSFPGLCLSPELKQDGAKCWPRGADATCLAGLGLCAASGLQKRRGDAGHSRQRMVRLGQEAS